MQTSKKRRCRAFSTAFASLLRLWPWVRQCAVNFFSWLLGSGTFSTASTHIFVACFRAARPSETACVVAFSSRLVASWQIFSKPVFSNPISSNTRTCANTSRPSFTLCAAASSSARFAPVRENGDRSGRDVACRRGPRFAPSSSKASNGFCQDWWS